MGSPIIVALDLDQKSALELANKKIGVWSPSRLFLNDSSGSDLEKKCTSKLTFWLSRQLNVKDIFSFGKDVEEIGTPLILSEILKSNSVSFTKR